ncbi:hypothetical protein QA612_19580 [Evansella sp. AB-P1]|uniref:hypothetical protein n=1 Tax=Evansella sp. AB-P1 TaxID=3037653 RepID=UPI00241E9A2B|nr:hypothetical protein [Evansella sp. AB-P1]MDG5789662.1 hypothetical protein [Evansella sp. AB-P1]
MYKDKGLITSEEQSLISRYSADIQGQIKDELLNSKEMQISFSYDKWIENMEEGLEINIRETDKGRVKTVGKLNTARLARALVEINDGISIKPNKTELEHDGRLEEFKQYPKGTRVKANGKIVEGSY